MKKQRKIIRIIHLIGAAAIGTFVYSPFSELGWFKLVMQIGVVPILTISGLWLWKPRWFWLGSKIANILLIGLFSSAVLQAQEVKPKISLKGGGGSFYIGYKTIETSDFNFFLPAEASSFESGLLQIGGDGYFFLNRVIIGGGGHYSRGDNFTFRGINYGLHGGGGYFTLGYGVWYKPGFLLFPYTNIGVEALSLNKGLDEDIDFSADQFTSMNYGIVSPTIDIGFGADWFPLKRGLKIGGRLGYQFALNQSPDWHHTSGNTVNDSQIPELGLDGLYFRLMIGGGYLR